MTLGLNTTQSATLLMLRENAFLVQGNTAKFETRIQTYREQLQDYLKALVPSNSANPARKAVSPRRTDKDALCILQTVNRSNICIPVPWSILAAGFIRMGY